MNSRTRFLVVTAVEAERNAVIAGLDGDERFDVVSGGVGQVEAAISTTNAIMSKQYDLVICAGIGGGFLNKAEVGSVVVATSVIAADLGVETSEGFICIDELDFGSSTRMLVDQAISEKLTSSFKKANLPTFSGPILTLSTVTGTKEKADLLASRVPDATVEAMEGYGVCAAASRFGIPFIEIRTISNLVGPRDRKSWKIKEALSMLQSISKVLVEVL